MSEATRTRSEDSRTRSEAVRTMSEASRTATIKAVGVVGAGTMGNGIAQVFAQAGFSVALVDVAQPMLDRARATIEKSLAKFVEKGKITATDRDAAAGRLSTTTSLDVLSGADYVVE